MACERHPAGRLAQENAIDIEIDSVHAFRIIGIGGIAASSRLVVHMGDVSAH